MLTPYLDTSSLDCALGLLSKNACDLLASQNLEILAAGRRLVVSFPGRGPRKRLRVHVMGAEVSSDGTSIGLVLSDADAELASSLGNVL